MIMDYEMFKNEIFKLTGIDLGSYKEKQMKRRIDSLISKNKFYNYYDYLNAIKINRHLFNEFLNFITINVSEFYRNPDQWEILEKSILPDILNKNRKLKIWSAACSTGDEPYTIAMILNNYLPLEDINILATDIDIEALNKAKAGIYSSKSLENLPEKYLKKYFTAEKNNNNILYKINDDIKNCVTFKQHNLLRDEYPKQCDLIICRNVLIYFTEEAKAQIYKKLNEALKNEGVLFVGSTEQIIMANKYNFRSLRTFFYVKN